MHWHAQLFVSCLPLESAVTTGSGVPAYLLSTLRPLAAVITRGWALQPRALVLCTAVVLAAVATGALQLARPCSASRQWKDARHTPSDGACRQNWKAIARESMLQPVSIASYKHAGARVVPFMNHVIRNVNKHSLSLIHI